MDTPNTFKGGDKVRKVGGDYSFEGVVVSVFKKIPKSYGEYNFPLATRVVVQNPDGILHIFNPKQLEVIE